MVMEMATTVKISEDLRKIIEDVQKEQNKEYFKEAHELLIRLGLETYQKRNATFQKIRIEEPIEDSENQIPPCPYASLVIKQTKNGLEYYSYCDNPMKKNLPKDRLIPIQACQKCWKREKIICCETFAKFFEPKAYCCTYEGSTLREQLRSLPCIKDPNWDFKYHECSNEDDPCPFRSEENRNLIRKYFGI